MRVEEPGEAFYRQNPGPALLGTFYLLKGTAPGIDAFAPENVLTFACGVAGGNLGTGLARFGVVAKSPLSGGVFESRGEGPFARGLKGSGFDALVIRGKAPEPAYLLIDGGKASVLPASGLWGKNTSETTTVLEERHGADASIATIGTGARSWCVLPASSAPAHTRLSGAAWARSMGSKNLKAVVIRNPVLPEVADAGALEDLARLFREEGLTQNTLNVWQKQPPGFSYWIDVVADPGYVSSRNGQAHDFQAPPAFAKDKYAGYLRAESPCPGCANDCIKTFNTRRLTEDDRAGGTSWETPAAFAINLDLTNLETYFDLNTLCMLHGLDPVSTGGVSGVRGGMRGEGLTRGGGLSLRVWSGG